MGNEWLTAEEMDKIRESNIYKEAHGSVIAAMNVLDEIKTCEAKKLYAALWVIADMIEMEGMD